MLALIGQVVLEKIFQNCGGRLYTTDDDGTNAYMYNIRSLYESKGLDTPKTVAFYYVGKR